MSAARWPGALGTVGGVVLGAVLLVAAWAKAIDPVAFGEQIESYGVAFLGDPGRTALAAVALEAGLGVALVLGVRRLWVLLPASALVAFFLFLTGRHWYLTANGLLDEAAVCGCFGNLVQRTPAEAFWQDLALLVPPLGLAFVGRPRGAALVPPLRAVVAAMAAAGATMLAWMAPGLPLDDLATRLKPGVAIGELCAGAEDDPARVCLDALAPGLESGEQLVIITTLTEESFLEAVPRLNERALSRPRPGLWALAAATPEDLNAFFWTHGPAFEVHESPPELLRPLYRALPRSFLVRDGVVAETWAGLPPFTEAGDPVS